MPPLLAIEWDRFEARVAVARRQGSNVMIEQAFCVSLLPREPGQTFADTNIGQRLAAALAARRVSRGDALVAVGRASIELRMLSLPPAPEEELPEMVRFLAQREFTALGEDWPIDFVPVDQTVEGGARVLAAALSPKIVGQIRETCGEGELKVHRLVMRPFAAASLLKRHGPRGIGHIQLMVDLLSEEADLTVLRDRAVGLMRTVRLPGEPKSQEQADALLGEIRRTMAAAQNQMGGQQVQTVVLCGSGDEHETLTKKIESDLSLKVENFDPFSKLSLDRELRSNPPDAPGRFAPLLGMLLDEATNSPHAIDFLKPRRREEDPGPRKNIVRGAIAAAALLFALVGYVVWSYLALGWETQRLADTSRGLDTKMKAAVRQMKETEEIAKWARADVIWLDQLYRLSELMPPPDEAIVTDFSGTVERGVPGITLKGNTVDSDVVDEMQATLRDQEHSAHPESSQQDKNRQDYPWQFIEKLTAPSSTPIPDYEPPPLPRSARGGGRPS
jgi:Tfp pilus assembly PilM family ATPase